MLLSYVRYVVLARDSILRYTESAATLYRISTAPARRAGKIINIASISGQLGSVTSPPYSVSKRCDYLQALPGTRPGPLYGINVNAICPGLLWTPMWHCIAEHMTQTPAAAGLTARQIFDQRVQERVPRQREQTLEDIGYAAVFLASDEACSITGQSLNVDGGMYMH